MSIVGARPQFIKAAPVSKCLRGAGIQEFLLHTGQHYDYGMSQVFFEELGIPEPNANLEIGSGTHAQQTGEMLIATERVLLAEHPDCVLVYGDTNSTLSGALAAVKLHIPVVHIEAGLRSFNKQMPEEHNRVLVDHCSDLLFCPTQTAVENLAHEGITQGVHRVGDVMYDAVLQFSKIAGHRSTILADLNVEPQNYMLVTLHRPYTVDDPRLLETVLLAFAEIDETIVFPVHPRTQQNFINAGLDEIKFKIPNLITLPPVGYLDMLMLEQKARLIMTDSGGIQKEAYFFSVPCLTLRPETEWIETVETGWNRLVKSDLADILANIRRLDWPTGPTPPVFGDGNASQLIAQELHRSI